MKLTPALLLVTILLASCTAAPVMQPVVPTQAAILPSPTAPTAMPALIATSAPPPTAVFLGGSRLSPDLAAGFVEPEPDIWVDVMPAVREYLYYRKKAVVSDDVTVLWNRYPDLKQGMNVQAGINVEQNLVQIYGPLKPIDGNIFPEQYERIKVKMTGDTAQVIVHGMELYLLTLTPGKYDESGGEFFIILSLRRQGNRWSVYQTTDISRP